MNAMMMFEAPLGTRILKRGLWIWLDQAGEDDPLWWSKDRRKWVRASELPSLGGCSNVCDCRTLKAFQRHIKKHPEIRGLTATLVGRFHGHNISFEVPA